MIRIQRAYNRPSRRPFRDDCAAIPAKPVWMPKNSWTLESVALTVAWPDGQQQSVSLTAVSTVQRLGGERWWWICPRCLRRCGVLLSPAVGEEFACRRCLRAVYVSDYPTRRRLRELGLFLRGEPGSPQDLLTRSYELDRPRRRGIRRGRRVQWRAIELMRRADVAMARIAGSQL